jgi:hypothetical protein
MARALCPKRKEHVVFALSTIAPAAAVRRRADGVAIEPFDDTGSESARLGLLSRKPAVERSCHPIPEDGVPVLGRPSTAVQPQEVDHFGLVLRESPDDLLGRRTVGPQQQAVAVDRKSHSDSPRRSDDLNRFHSRASYVRVSGRGVGSV